MTPDKMKALRIALRIELQKYFPQADAVDIGWAVRGLEKVVVREAARLVDVEHCDECACWDCLGRLHGEVHRWQSEVRVRQRDNEERW